MVVAFIGSIFFYSEAMTISKLLGAALVLIALTVVGMSQGLTKKTPPKALFIGISVSTLLGLGWIFDKMGALYFGVNTYNILVWTVPVVFILAPHIKVEEIKHEIKVGSWKVVLMAGLNVAGYLLQLKALETGDATRVIPIVQTSTLLAVILGIVLLKEKAHALKKIFAAMIALVGVYFLTATNF